MKDGLTGGVVGLLVSLPLIYVYGFMKDSIGMIEDMSNGNFFNIFGEVFGGSYAGISIVAGCIFFGVLGFIAKDYLMRKDGGGSTSLEVVADPVGPAQTPQTV